MKFSGNSPYCWNTHRSTATAVGFRTWNNAKQQGKELWVLPAVMVVNSMLCVAMLLFHVLQRSGLKICWPYCVWPKSTQSPWTSLVRQNLVCALQETPCLSALLCWHLWVSLSKTSSCTLSDVGIATRIFMQTNCTGSYSAQASLNPEINSMLCICAMSSDRSWDIPCE